jgi:hypothetical protein
MNLTKNQTLANATDGEYYSLDFILTNFAGSTWNTDNFNFWPFVTLGPVAMLLNLLAFLILQNSDFSIDLYKYMRVYTANNALFSLLITFNWTNASIRIIPWTNSQLAQIVSVYFLINASNVIYFFGNIIDVLMLFDRIAIFKKKIKTVLKIHPYKMCCLAFVCVVLVDSPFYFVLVVEPLPFKLNATSTFIVWSYTNSAFASSKLGTVLTYMVYAVRDVVVCLAQISLNLTLILSFKQYIDKRIALHGMTGVFLVSETNKIDTHRQAPTPINVRPSKSPKIGVGQQSRVSSADKRATVMCILVCILSLIEHLLVFASVLYPYFSTNAFVSLLIFSVLGLWQILKRIADFFILFFVNKVFKKACVKFFRVN